MGAIEIFRALMVSASGTGDRLPVTCIDETILLKVYRYKENLLHDNRHKVFGLRLAFERALSCQHPARRVNGQMSKAACETFPPNTGENDTTRRRHAPSLHN
jgi:hypothetical protein